MYIMYQFLVGTQANSKNANFTTGITVWEFPLHYADDIQWVLEIAKECSTL